MPTDPFVPSELADLPRQQQNLPPGVATPPAADWRSDRPGDLGANPPEGALFGRPGPNVGYAYTLAQRAKDRLRLGPFEHAHDAIAVIAEVAGKRAALDRLLALEGELLHALDDDLSEFARKHDYRYLGEKIGAEGDSWIRAIGLVAGKPGIR